VPYRNLVSTEAKKLGTIQQYAHQSGIERMSMKAQDVALDRLLVDRFKQGIRLPSRRWSRATGTTDLFDGQPALAQHAGRRRGDPGHIHPVRTAGFVNFPGCIRRFRPGLPDRTNLRAPLLVLVAAETRQTVSFDQRQLRGETTLAEIFQRSGDAGRHHRHREFVNRSTSAWGNSAQAPRDLDSAQRQNMSYEEIRRHPPRQRRHGEKAGSPGRGKSCDPKWEMEFK